MFNWIKENWYVPLAILILLIFFFFSGHKVPVQNTTITPIGWSKPSIGEVKLYGANRSLEVAPIPQRLGYKPSTVIIETKDNKLLQITTQKLSYGLEYKTGFWIGGLLSLDGGLSLDLLNLWRLNLGILAGVKSSGIDLNYQLFNNTYIGAGYNYTYKLEPSPVLFIKVLF